jgi:hypothetical protein
MCHAWAFLLGQLDLPSWKGLVSLLRNQVLQISLPFTDFIFVWGFSRSSHDQFRLQLEVFDFGFSTFADLPLSAQHQALANPNPFSVATGSALVVTEFLFAALLARSAKHALRIPLGFSHNHRWSWRLPRSTLQSQGLFSLMFCFGLTAGLRFPVWAGQAARDPLVAHSSVRKELVPAPVPLPPVLFTVWARL